MPFSYPMWNKVEPLHSPIWRLPLNRTKAQYCSGITCIVHWMVIIVPNMRVVPSSKDPSGVSHRWMSHNSIRPTLHACVCTTVLNYDFSMRLCFFAVGNVWTHDRTQFAIRPCGLYRDYESSWEYMMVKWVRLRTNDKKMKKNSNPVKWKWDLEVIVIICTQPLSACVVVICLYIRMCVS